MISFLSKIVTLFLFNMGIVDEEKKPVCQYGFEIIISTIIGFSIVSLSVIILGELYEALLFYILFVGVRLFTGGYHANTHFKCKLTLLMCCLFVLITIKYFRISIKVKFVLLILYLITIFLFSPL